MKQALATAQAPAAIGPYSQGIAAGQTVYVSGQLPIDPATGAIPEGVAAQTAQSLKNIQAILAEQGMTLADVVKTTVLLADMGDFAACNAVYSQFFTENCPARACFAVKALPKGALVEIEAIAAKYWGGKPTASVSARRCFSGRNFMEMKKYTVTAVDNSKT